MKVRTDVLGQLLLLSVAVTGCATDSASTAPEPTPQGQVIRSSELGTAQDKTAQEEVVWVLPPRVESKVPQPSVVRWIGGPPESSDVIASDADAGAAVPEQLVEPVTSKGDDRPVGESRETTARADVATPGVAPVLKTISKPSVVAVAANSGSKDSQALSEVVSVAKQPAQEVAGAATAKPAVVAATSGNPQEQKIARADVTPRRFEVPVQQASPPVRAAAPSTRPAIALAKPVQTLRPVARPVVTRGPFKALQPVLEGLPNEVRPSGAGWDALSIWKTRQWILDRLAGSQLQVRVKLAGLKLVRISDAQNPNETIGWELGVTTQPECFRAFDIETFHWPTTWTEDAMGKRWRGGDVWIAVTEEFANRARLWHIGDTIILSGTVEDVAIEGGTTSLGHPCGKFTTILRGIHIDKVVPQSNQP